MNAYWKNIGNSLAGNRTILLWILASLAFAVSFIRNPQHQSLERETERIQRKVTERQRILERYVLEAMNTPESDWISLKDFPDDMVIYRYLDDTLQSWANLFPLGNDDIFPSPFMHRISDMGVRNYYSTPMAYLPYHDQYTNLGSGWYITRVYLKGRMRIVSGILVRHEYAPENALLRNDANPELGLNRLMSTVPVSLDDTHIVYGRNGHPLFSIISSTGIAYEKPFSTPRWIAVLLALLALFSFHLERRSLRSLVMTVSGLTVIRISSALIAQGMETEHQLFSPALYADINFFDSLSGLLINHLYVVLLSLAVYFVRKPILRRFGAVRPSLRRLVLGGFILASVLLAAYIHLSLRSLLLNSNIILELYKLEELTGYTALIYLAYILLFYSLLLSVGLILLLAGLKRRYPVFSTRFLGIYTIGIALYTVTVVSIYGFYKERERCKIWSTKLAVERDLPLEFQLRNLEDDIASDPIIRALAGIPSGRRVIQDRISEHYLWNFLQSYEINAVICSPVDMLQTDAYAYPVNCFHYMNRDIIEQFGIPLSANSRFYYINDYRSTISYLGSFPILNRGKHHNLYLQITSKLSGNPVDVVGYPSLLLDNKKIESSKLPSYYSYAKYYDNRLISYHGRYNYPMQLTAELKDGYSVRKINGAFHFFNKISEERIIVISRGNRSLFSYVIFFSYICLFYGAFLFGVTRLSRQRRTRFFILPRNSLRRKITFLLTSALVIALLCLGIGSIVFAFNLMQENNRVQMEEKLMTVQTTLSDLVKYAQSYVDINTLEMHDGMDRVSGNTQVDINLFDPHGTLIRSTKSEVFDRMLVSSRINPDAFRQIMYGNRKLVILEEQVASLSYYSLYAPVFNSNGKIIAIVNIPYFNSYSGLHGEASTIIAAIINIYLLLLLAALIVGTFVSNSLTKPLAEISRKMQSIDFSQKAEHIDYRNRDEIGLLVNTYNKMVDDLEQSSRQLAESEREQAWREMARQIAHEIKNPLTPMRLSIQHLRRMKQQEVPNWEQRFDAVSTSLLEQIDILSDTAAEFSNFAKFYNEENSILDLNSLIKDQITLFNNRDNIAISFTTDFEVAYVYARKSQLTRVFVNLISNAVQAVEAQRDAEIRICVQGEDDCFRVDVADNGPGVKPEDRHRLFKPNFTTKSGGTGLGLAICKNIIDQSNGEIRYEASETGGADFIIRLPKYVRI